MAKSDICDAGALLCLLQHGDSFFPSGGTALSWGVEPMLSDAEIDGIAQLKRFVVAQLQGRWATFDRWVLRKAFEADIEGVIALDHLVESMSLAQGLRRGSARAGQALLGMHGRLGLERAAEYRRVIAEGQGFGHLSVMQGFLFSHLGMPLAGAELVSAHLLVTGFASAAVRLNHIGPTEAQQMITDCRAEIAAIVEGDCDWDHPFAFQPCTEIACMRHERRAARLFSN